MRAIACTTRSSEGDPAVTGPAGREESAVSSEVRIVAIAGGSASGKTTFANRLQRLLGPDLCTVLSQDRYYIDQSAIFRGDGENVNFDHPSALDLDLMAAQIAELRQGLGIEAPIYDFASHKRLKETTRIAVRPVILVDGTLILTHPGICELADHRIFIQASESVRYERRLRRDTRERGRSPEGVRKQFERQVKPMHDQFVEPSRQQAHVVISGERSFDAGIEEWARRLKPAIPE